MTAEEAIKVLRDIKLGIFIDTYFDEPEKFVSKENKALEIAIDTLYQQPCKDAISREAVDEYITNLLSGYLYDEERTRLEDLTAYIWELPSVTPQPKIGHWILLDECSNSGYYCSECHKKVIKEGWSKTVKKVKYCPNCGARMAESEDKE